MSTPEDNTIDYTTTTSQENPEIPTGYTLIRGRGQHSFLVPTYMVPATKMAMALDSTRLTLDVDNGSSGPRPTGNYPFDGIAEGQVKIPVDPDLSEREALNLHAEVKALQETLGISYKDAAHRLYMAEVNKMKAEKDSEVAFTKVRQIIDNTIINEVYPVITEIDKRDD